MTDSKPITIKEEDKVPFRKKLAYAAGGPVDILGVWVMVSIAYQVFNFELKMTPTQVAIILMSLRLWDGVADPVMGWISDNFRSKWGRRRPFILFGAILAGLTYPLIWWFPTDMESGQIMAWVIGFGILFYSCFTVWAMPYQSMLMEMTPDYNERTRVAEIRGYFQTLAGLLNGWIWKISLVISGIFFTTKSTILGMHYVSIVIGILIIILGILPAIFVKERYYESDLVKNQEKVNLFKSLSETFSNRPFIILCLLTLFFLLGTSIFDSYGRFVGTYYVLHGDWDRGADFSGYGTFVYTGFSLLFIPIFRHLSEKIGKPKVLTISILIVLVAVSTTWWTFTPDNPWLMLTNTAFIGAGYAGLWLMIPSMQVDVVDYDELKTGERREGSYASIFSWVLKLSFVIGFMISGPVIEMTGFDANLNADQKEGVYDIMRIGYIAIPVFALIVAVALLKVFPITKQKASEIREQLEARRGKV